MGALERAQQAADDGVIPQTREHLAILELLGVSRGAVALTKVDRVAAERVAEVQAEIDELLGTVIDVFPSLRGRARPECLAYLGAMELDDHEAAPDGSGPPEDRILDDAEVRIPREVVVALAEELVHDGLIVREGVNVRLPGHRMQLSRADAALWDKSRALLEQSELRPPSVAELAGELGEDARRLDLALSRLERHGLVVRVSKNRFFLPATLRRLERIAQEEAGASGAITAAAFRDRSQIGRNLAIEVLEFFDRTKFTRRAGDSHVLVRAPQGKDSGRDSHPGGAPGLQIQ